MRVAVLVAALGLWTLPATAADLPEWAYPLTPPPKPLDNVVQKQMPGSTKKYTQAQIEDAFNPPDWYPQDHPPMPDVVAHGRMENKVQACMRCHLSNGAGHPESAGIAGLPTGYFIRQMADFKAATRKGMRAPLMIQFAKSLTDDDVKAAADYFGSLKSPLWYKVVETDAVPKSYVGSGAMRFVVPDGGNEPIGNRIIELPQDQEGAESRNPRTGFIANVPTGSIKKGEAIVTTGDGGKTIACGICHGAELKGLADIPSIVGRSPMYVYRQLNDIKIGARDGAMVPLMKAVVAKLDESDMIAISAYLASMQP